MIKKAALFCIISLFVKAKLEGQIDTSQVIKNLDTKLAKRELAVSGILSDTAYMYLHSKTVFREMIRKRADESVVNMIADAEPGTRIIVKGSVIDPEGRPVKNAAIYVYQTSDKGWYSDTAAHILVFEGDIRHARLFAYLKTDDNGKFVIHTIKPKGYPRSDLAAHIHIHLWDKDNRPLGGPGELQFDDDPRMTPERRKKSLQEGYLISKNTGTVQQPVYEFTIMTR